MHAGDYNTHYTKVKYEHNVFINLDILCSTIIFKLCYTHYTNGIKYKHNHCIKSKCYHQWDTGVAVILYTV